MEFKPDDIVLSCKYLEMGCSFVIYGMDPCKHGSIAGPRIVSADEINSGVATYEMIVSRRKQIFEALNGGGGGDTPTADCKICHHLKEVKYRNVSFDFLGGEMLPGAFSIQHYTICNEKCSYCYYTKRKEFVPPRFNILDVYNQFKKHGKIRGNNWIDFSGGEPALLENFDEIIKYYDDNNMGEVDVYSNALKYSQQLYDLLKKNKIFLTTSIDTGIPSTYERIRHGKYSRVMENLIKYRNSGTKNLWLKYVIVDDNRTEDDLWSFVFAILAIRPNSVMISPDFPYGDNTIPEETSKFAARLWVMIEKFAEITPIEYTAVMLGEKYNKYRKELYDNIAELKNTPEFSYKLPLVLPEMTNCNNSGYEEGLKLTEEKLAMTEERLKLSDENLRGILNSRTYRYGRKITGLIRKIFPRGSKRASFMKAIFKPVKFLFRPEK